MGLFGSKDRSERPITRKQYDFLGRLMEEHPDRAAKSGLTDAKIKAMTVREASWAIDEMLDRD